MMEGLARANALTRSLLCYNDISAVLFSFSHDGISNKRTFSTLSLS
jgi:hypothetical protein